MESRQKTSRRTLILNVDRDNDIGIKTRLIPPLVGKDVIIEAAKQLLLTDPEDADGNALFATVKIYEEYETEEGEEKEVAAITGSDKGGIEADKKMIRELETVLNIFPADNIILVTDGYEDEEILPILLSRVPISSVRHIVVKHSRSVEETYAVIGRYLKMLWRERPYRLYFIGIPGAIILIGGILFMMNLFKEAISIGMIILGGAFAVKGFGIDDYISSIIKGPTEEIIRLFTYIASLTSFLTGVYIAYLSISELPEFNAVISDPNNLWVYGAYLLGNFLQPFLITLVITAFIYSIGMFLYGFFSEVERHLVRYIFTILGSIILYPIGQEVSLILINPEHGITGLLFYIGIGLGILFSAIAITYVILRVRGGREIGSV
jgi:putative membrane protein